MKKYINKIVKLVSNKKFKRMLNIIVSTYKFIINIPKYLKEILDAFERIKNILGL